jgi:hypothetical protein
MSSATFNLMSNTSTGDQLLYAQDFLKQRIESIIRNKAPVITKEQLLSLPKNLYSEAHDSILPSLNEIEKSHNVFVNSTYKPCVQITSEYTKVQYQNPKFDSEITFQVPQTGDFTSDSMLHIRLSGMSAIDTRDRVRYVSMLGHRLVKKVQFLADENYIIDEYTTDDYNMHYQYDVPSNHRVGYLRSIGQEVPDNAYVTNDPANDLFREYKTIGSGNQTLKYSHDTVDIMIPVLFWFQKLRNALPTLPWGLLQIRVTLAPVTDIIASANSGGGGKYNPPTIQFCNLYANQLHIDSDVFNIFKKKFVFSIIRTHRSHKQIIKASNEQEYEIKLNSLKWPTEALYVAFRPRENLALSQYWHKNTKLTQKFYRAPVVAKDFSTIINVTLAAYINSYSIAISSSLPLSTFDNDYRNYDLAITGGQGFDPMGIEKNRYYITSYIAAGKVITIENNWKVKIDTTTTFEMYISSIAVNRVTFYKEEPVIETMSISAAGIDLYGDNLESFYGNYIPSKFSGINTPSDIGNYLIPFCTKLGNHDPSGSFNIIPNFSPLFIKFKTKAITSDYPVDLLVMSRAINFLLIDSKSGNISMKYTI